MTMRCAQCGKPMAGRMDKVFCSKKCLNASYRAEIRQEHRERFADRTCGHCGGPIDPARPSYTVFCSVACQRKARYQRGGVSIAAYVPPAPKTCLHCGKPYLPKTDRQMYCSIQCHGATRRVLPDRTCEHCGATFRPRNSPERFCSQSCGGKAAAAKRQRKRGLFVATSPLPERNPRPVPVLRQEDDPGGL